MLKSLELENFKAFGKRTKIPLAPINLIFGENSAGKSSILQSLHLLKQTLDSRDENDLLLPRAKHGIADLGSFNEMIFDHDLNRSLSIRLDIDETEYISDKWRDLHKIADCLSSAGMEFTFARPDKNSDVSLQRVKCYSDDIGQTPLTIYESDSSLNDSTEEKDERVVRRLRCTYMSSEPDFWETEHNNLKKHIEKIVTDFERTVRDLKERIEEEIPREIEQDIEDGESEADVYEYNQPEIEFLTEYYSKREEFLKIYRAGFSIDDYIKYRLPFYLKNFSEIGFVKFLPRYKGWDSEEALIMFEEDEKTGKILAPEDIPRFNERISFPIKVGDIVSNELQSIFPLGPSRCAPERYYIFPGTSPTDVGYDGDSLPDYLFRHPGVLKDVNRWLKELEIDYEIKTRSIGAALSDLYEMRLTDTNRNVDVGLPDVGFGVSQLLPFIVQSLTPEPQIITIEQPEVHVHPRLQASLGELLTEGVKKHHKQFLIETHSEHLVLRLQRLIRYNELSPEDVSILYVERTSEGSIVRRLNIDEEGDFIDEWPGGFFPERLQELI